MTLGQIRMSHDWQMSVDLMVFSWLFRQVRRLRQVVRRVMLGKKWKDGRPEEDASIKTIKSGRITRLAEAASIHVARIPCSLYFSTTSSFTSLGSVMEG